MVVPAEPGDEGTVLHRHRVRSSEAFDAALATYEPTGAYSRLGSFQGLWDGNVELTSLMRREGYLQGDDGEDERLGLLGERGGRLSRMESQESSAGGGAADRANRGTLSTLLAAMRPDRGSFTKATQGRSSRWVRSGPDLGADGLALRELLASDGGAEFGGGMSSGVSGAASRASRASAEDVRRLVNQFVPPPPALADETDAREARQPRTRVEQYEAEDKMVVEEPKLVRRLKARAANDEPEAEPIAHPHVRLWPHGLHTLKPTQ
jgi:hypothetical protein